LTRPLGTLTRPFCSIYGRPLSQKMFFSKPIRRLEPIERPAEEAMWALQCGYLGNNNTVNFMGFLAVINTVNGTESSVSYYYNLVQKILRQQIHCPPPPPPTCKQCWTNETKVYSHDQVKLYCFFNIV
jgi:hypothetical protein